MSPVGKSKKSMVQGLLNAGRETRAMICDSCIAPASEPFRDGFSRAGAAVLWHFAERRAEDGYERVNKHGSLAVSTTEGYSWAALELYRSANPQPQAFSHYRWRRGSERLVQ